MAEISASPDVAPAAGAPPLLATDEPAAFEVYNETGAALVLLVCDHASPLSRGRSPAWA